LITLKTKNNIAEAAATQEHTIAPMAAAESPLEDAPCASNAADALAVAGSGKGGSSLVTGETASPDSSAEGRGDGRKA
jgi:hypothetical protein